jgi:hypothetical protein
MQPGGLHMADNKSTHSAVPPTRHDFPEVKDKIIESVEIIVDSEYYGISIRCTDKTSLTFAMEPCLFGFPVFEDWTTGEAQQLRQYRPIRSEISSD